MELGETYQPYRDEIPEESFVHVYTFNSTRKSMSTVIEKPGGGYRLFSKGASEILLGKCTQYVNESGNVQEFSNNDKTNLIKSIIEPMASNGLRTICIAYRDFALDKGKSFVKDCISFILMVIFRYKYHIIHIYIPIFNNHITQTGWTINDQIN